MTKADFLSLDEDPVSDPDRDSIRALLSSLWCDLVWTVERAMSVEIHRRDNEPDDESRELSYLPGDTDDALQHLARLIELLLLGHRIDWQKPGPRGSTPPYFLGRGATINPNQLEPLGAHPLDPAPGTDPLRALLNAGKQFLVRLDEDTTTYRQIRHTGGTDADALAQRMSETARTASATLARAIELLLRDHHIDAATTESDAQELREFKKGSTADWLTAQHPSTMCKMLRPLDYGHALRFPARKWQLFSLACVRRISGVFRDSRTLALLDASEQFIEGTIPAEELPRQRREANSPENPDRGDDERAQSGYNALHSVTRGDAQGAMHAASEARYAAENPHAESLAQAALVREVFGNPYRLTPPDPAWLDWNSGTVVLLARGIYEDRAFDRMPILADALEDAGCANTDILEHCRGAHEHVRGCWVLDLLLGNHFAARPDEGTTT